MSKINGASNLAALAYPPKGIQTMIEAMQKYNHVSELQGTLNGIAAMAAKQAKFLGAPMDAPWMRMMADIQSNHSKIMSGWVALSRAMASGIEYQRMLSIHSAFGSILSQAAVESIKTNNWEAIEAFQEVSTEVALISEQVIEQQQVTKQDLQKLGDLILVLLSKVWKAGNDNKGLVFLLFFWLGRFGDIITVSTPIISLYSDHQPVATKADLDQLRHDVYNLISTQAEPKDYRILSNNCHLRAKPNTKAISLGVISKGTEVIIISYNKKWVQVTFTDVDGSIVYGWMYKKYLKKVKR